MNPLASPGAPVQGAPADADAPAVAPQGRRPRSPLRRRTMTFIRVSHRWVSLVAGVLLLAVTTTGAILVFEPEYRQVLDPGQYATTHADRPRTPDEAVAAARRAYPDRGAATRVVRNRGVYQVALGETPETMVNVDPGSGRVLGATRPERGVLGFVMNLHECGMTCEGYPGYIAFLATPMPGLGIQGLDQVQVGSFLLAATAIVLLLLTLSGVVLWWPGLKRWARGFELRRGKGRYKRDYDLHKLVGVVALPFLGMWAITGMDFELPVVGNAVYAVIGAKPAEPPPFVSKPAAKGTPDLSVVRAERAAQRLVPGSTLVGTNLPEAGDRASTYLVWVAHGLDPLRDGTYPGNVGVAVDRHTGAAKVLYGQLGRPLRQTIWEDWTTGAHYGQVFGWIPRTVWFAFGMTPLLLAITGLSTWLYKRGKGKERKRRRAAAAAAGGPA